MIQNRIFEVTPLFSSPLSTIQVEEDLNELQKCDFFDLIKKENFSYFENFQDYKGKYFGITDTKQLLDKFPEIKQLFLSYFYSLKNNVLKYNEVDFCITTSWGIRVVKDSCGVVHNHRNSFYSGIYYFDDYSNEESAGISFIDFNIKPNLFMIQTSDFNILNTDSWTIKPQKNTLLFFPSYLYHRIDLHKSDIDRYSIAFNIMPTGVVGHQDSTYNYSSI